MNKQPLFPNSMTMTALAAGASIPIVLVLLKENEIKVTADGYWTWSGRKLEIDDVAAIIFGKR